MTNKICKVKLPIGDWSDDGHGECDYYLLNTTHSAEQMRRAYYESEKKTGLTFRYRYNDNPARYKSICTEYEESYINEDQIEGLIKAGFDFEILDLYGEEIPTLDNMTYDMIYIGDSEQIAKMILWFIGLSLRDFEYEFVKDDGYETLTQYGAGNFSHQFGYGVFN